ncbi:hypothetical protein P3W45_000711 [Vairimorpha bombi]|jgi:hypothetical protein
MILSTKDKIIKLTSKLQILDINTLKEIHVIKKYKISCISILSDTSLLYGTVEGSLYTLCLKKFDTTNIHNHPSEMKKIFVLDNFIYTGYNDGTILKLILKAKQVSQFKMYKHRLPVNSLISNGSDILVSDMTDKVVSYPSMITYDIIDPIFEYMNYIFISEKNVLYCLSRNSLCSYLQTDTYIKKFFFSKNGGVLFVILYERIIVYDFNDKSVIKEISKSFKDAVFDEKNNRVIGFYDTGKEVVEGILDDVYDDMDNVVFSENKIYEKRVKINEDEEYKIRDDYYYEEEDEYYEDEEFEECENEEEEDTKRKKKDKIEDTKRKKKDKIEDTKKDKIEDNKKDKMSERKRRNIISDSSSEEYNRKETNVQVFPIINKNDRLFYYTDQGYLISIKGSEYNKIEIRYHDKLKQTVERNDYNDCTQGTFYNENILICNRSTAYFYAEYDMWTKDLKREYNTIIGMSHKYVIINNGITNIYDTKGKEIFNFFIQDITNIVLSSSIIFIFSTKLTIINLFNNTEEYTLPGKASWGYYYNSRVYYKIGNDIFILYKKLSYRVHENVEYPLAVVGSRLVSMDDNIRILPVPNINFQDLPSSIHNFMSIENMSSQVKEKDIIINKEKTTDEEINLEESSIRDEFDNKENDIFGSISDEGSIFDEQVKSTVTPTKKYNLFKK